MATIGRNKAVADLNFVHFSGFPAWLAWLFIHVLYLVGFPESDRGALPVGLGLCHFQQRRAPHHAKLPGRAAAARLGKINRRGCREKLDFCSLRPLRSLRLRNLLDALPSQAAKLPHRGRRRGRDRSVTTEESWPTSGATCISSCGSDYEVVRKTRAAPPQQDGKHSRRESERLSNDAKRSARATSSSWPSKRPPTRSCRPLIAPLLGEKTMILTLQNGLGNEEFLAEHFGAERILGGICFICLNRIRARRGRAASIPARLTIGEFRGYPQPRTHDLAWEFKRCGVVCSVTADLALERWRKLVWNIPFNGLSVVGRRHRYREDSGRRGFAPACAGVDGRNDRDRECLRTQFADRARSRPDEADGSHGRFQAVNPGRLSGRPAAGNRSDLGRAAAPRQRRRVCRAAAGNALSPARVASSAPARK